jgi:hypothetical protein
VVVDVAHGVHGLEALIGVVVAVEDQVDPANDQLGPQVLELSLAGVGAGGGAVGMMEEGQGAALVVAGQVVLEPGPLGRAVGARRRPGGAAVGVERDRVPGADVEGVVALGGVASLPAEVPE